MMGINVNSLQSKPKGNDKDVVIFNAVFLTLSQQLRVKKAASNSLSHAISPLVKPALIQLELLKLALTAPPVCLFIVPL